MFPEDFLRRLMRYEGPQEKQCSISFIFVIDTKFFLVSSDTVTVLPWFWWVQ